MLSDQIVNTKRNIRSLKLQLERTKAAKAELRRLQAEARKLADRILKVREG